MTGFGQAEGGHGGFRIVWRLKSVNHRFLDVVVRLPEGLADLELAVVRKLKGMFHRGRLEVALAVMPEAGSRPFLDLDVGLLGSILALESRILAEIQPQGTRARLDLGRLLAWPGVVRERGALVDARLHDEELSVAILETLEVAGEALRCTRQREGEQLEQAVFVLLAGLKECIEQVNQRLPDVRARLESRFREKVRALIETPVDEDRLAQELVFMLNRVDVSEEMERLDIHFREMISVLGSGVAAGRQLDFICQELGREANTLCSKAQDGVVSRLGVEMKVVVEKLREQVQNLE